MYFIYYQLLLKATLCILYIYYRDFSVVYTSPYTTLYIDWLNIYVLTWIEEKFNLRWAGFSRRGSQIFLWFWNLFEHSPGLGDAEGRCFSARILAARLFGLGRSVCDGRSSLLYSQAALITTDTMYVRVQFIHALGLPWRDNNIQRIRQLPKFLYIRWFGLFANVKTLHKSRRLHQSSSRLTVWISYRTES